MNMLKTLLMKTVKLPKYSGKNKFIKLFLKSDKDSFVYWGLDQMDCHNITYTQDKNNVVIEYNIIAGMKFRELDNNQIELYLITVNPEIRKRGLGTKLLNQIKQIATLSGYSIVLTPSNVFNTEKLGNRIGLIAYQKRNKIKIADLRKWYKKHGFVNYGKDEKGKPMLIFRP